MFWLVLAAVVIVLLSLAALKLKRPRSSAEGYPYSQRAVLFSPAERSFLGVLDQAVGDEYRVFGKVRVADVIAPQRGQARSDFQSALNRISAKHFDFVLCGKDDLSVICAIELDDQSHQKRKRQDRDAFLVAVCEAVSLPLVQVAAQRAYSIADVRARVLAALAQGDSSVIDPPPVRHSADAADLAPVEVPNDGPSNQDDAGPLPPDCPRCGAPTVLRQAKSGDNAGRAFWGCRTFPRCRGLLQVAPEAAEPTAVHGRTDPRGQMDA